MSHLFESGFFVRKAAWHGLGTVEGASPKTWKTARKKAGLDWEPVGAPVYGFQGLTKDGTVTYDHSHPDLVVPHIDLTQHKTVPELMTALGFSPIEEKQRVVRSGRGNTLGVPTSEYQVIDHNDLGLIVEALNGMKGVEYETLVVLDSGKQVWVVIRLDEPKNIGKDQSPTYPFLSVGTNHSGNGSVTAMGNTIRIVCANTSRMAFDEATRSGRIFTFPHKGNWREYIEPAREAILGLRDDFSVYNEFANDLAKMKVPAAKEKLFLERFIPMPITSVELSDRQIENIENARLQVIKILESDTVQGSGIRGTGFGLYQGGIEYLDWYKNIERRSASGIFKSQILGQGAQQTLRQKNALGALVREVVNA